MHEYLRVIQTQDDWLRWDLTADADDMWANTGSNPAIFSLDMDGHKTAGRSYVAEVRPMYRAPLMSGEPYYVAPHIVNNLARLAPTMPVTPFTESLLLSRYGFALLADPLWIARAPWPKTLLQEKFGAGEAYDVDADTEIALDALGWLPARDGVQFVGYQRLAMIEMHNAAMAKKLTDMFPDPSAIKAMAEASPDKKIRVALTNNDLLEQRGKIFARPGFFPITHFNIQFGETADDVVADFQRVLESERVQRADRRWVTDEQIDIETKFTFALFQFMNDKRVVVRKQHLPRGFRRNQPRPEPITNINVIMLRAEEEQGYNEHTGMPEPREWDWQWDVREHMRFNRRTGKKDIHVSAYRKGPPDKPLKPRGRDIYVVSR